MDSGMNIIRHTLLSCHFHKRAQKWCLRKWSCKDLMHWNPNGILIWLFTCAKQCIHHIEQKVTHNIVSVSLCNIFHMGLHMCMQNSTIWDLTSKGHLQKDATYYMYHYFNFIADHWAIDPIGSGCFSRELFFACILSFEYSWLYRHLLLPHFVAMCRRDIFWPYFMMWKFYLQ